MFKGKHLFIHRLRRSLLQLSSLLIPMGPFLSPSARNPAAFPWHFIGLLLGSQGRAWREKEREKGKQNRNSSCCGSYRPLFLVLWLQKRGPFLTYSVIGASLGPKTRKKKGKTNGKSFHLSFKFDFPTSSSIIYFSEVPSSCSLYFDFFPSRWVAMVQRDTSTPMFITALFTVAEIWKQPKCQWDRGNWIKKMWHRCAMEYFTSYEREWNNAIGSNEWT